MTQTADRVFLYPISKFQAKNIRGSIRAVLFGVIDRYIKLLCQVSYIMVV
uniref:Uncharacterized protein n=1 Tax=Myoviridae sp. ctBoB21 TaxID=2827287 RepID=A0A8S5R6Q7_9CAUD|nr:MAG TPA: hypothetical protein [Myoviridae sp. ctBoB21]